MQGRPLRTLAGDLPGERLVWKSRLGSDKQSDAQPGHRNGSNSGKE
jgi:hypothetical protein